MSVANQLHRNVRTIYTGYLRTILSSVIFDYGGYPLLTRQRMHNNPPDYMSEFAQYFSTEIVDIDSPEGAGPVPSNHEEIVREWKFVRPFVAVIDNIDLVGPNALAVAEDGAFVVEATTGSTLRVIDAVVRAIGAGVMPIHQGTGRGLETAVSFAGPWSGEFFHWFADFLPRLRVLQKWERITNEAPQVIIPSDPQSWVVDSLTRLGVPPERQATWRGGRLSVDRLIVPSMPRHTHSTAPPEGYVHSPREIGWVRDRLLETVSEVCAPDVGQRLYVSRSRQPTRRVKNESDLLSVAAEYGFEMIYPEDYSLAKQVAAFSQAEAVLGPHGAGLLNAIYGENTTLIELFGERTNPCFFAIADALEMPYFMTRCEPIGVNLRVDPNRLQELLEIALNS